LIYRAERLTDASGFIEQWALKHDKERKVWVARRARIETEGLPFKRIEVEGMDWPQRKAGRGITSRLDVLANAVVSQRGKASGDVTRWVILDGMLREVEMIARDVAIEGWPDSPASASAAV
jgi:hypothetical protein